MAWVSMPRGEGVDAATLPAPIGRTKRRSKCTAVRREQPRQSPQPYPDAGMALLVWRCDVGVSVESVFVGDRIDEEVGFSRRP